MRLTLEELEQAGREYGLWVIDYTRGGPGAPPAPKTARDIFIAGWADGRERRPADAVNAECMQVLDDEASGRDWLVIDPDDVAAVRWRRERVLLTPTSRRLVVLLHSRRGDLLSAEELFAALTSGRTGENLKEHIRWTRQAFLAVDPAFDRIQSVYGRGYRWA